VADAKIEYTGKGVIAEKQKPGLVTRIFKLLF
jgi:flagellar basal body L-ring protein FlgH